MMSTLSSFSSRNHHFSPSPPTHSTPRSHSSTSQRKDEPRIFVFESTSVTQNRSSSGPITTRTIAKMDRLHPSSPPRTTTIVTRPVAPSSPVEIPPTRHETAHNQQRHHHHPHHTHLHMRHANLNLGRTRSLSRQRPRKPEDVPPSVASLLAVTSIPPPSRRRSSRRTPKDKPMTVDSIIEQTQVVEKTLSLTLGKTPMELLLSAPEDLEGDDDEISISDSTVESTLSTRTVSVESMPSLVNSASTATLSSIETPCSLLASRRCRPRRISLEPITSPGEKQDHPLLTPKIDLEDLDFRVFGPEHEQEEEQTSMFHPLRSAFKSNLTASLKALKSAAKSFSSLNFTSIPPEDFLTRSLLTLDPNVPYTDERRPPVLESEPPAALRRYLNPTSLSREESRPSTATPGVPSTRSFTASIQMQTYKVHRTRALSQPAARIPHSGSGSSSSSSTTNSSSSSSSSQQGKSGPFSYPPGPRALRENSDFIRIAVMEMAMRRRGKLSDESPGHARLALAPRKTSLRPYEIGPDGVPLRWVPESA